MEKVSMDIYFVKKLTLTFQKEKENFFKKKNLEIFFGTERPGFSTCKTCHHT